MSACNHLTDAAACCAFCGKPLPISDGQLQPWRAASGLLFCNEFCADDAEEASFQSRGRTGGEVRNRAAWWTGAHQRDQSAGPVVGVEPTRRVPIRNDALDPQATSIMHRSSRAGI
jgi:hypothetical protein